MDQWKCVRTSEIFLISIPELYDEIEVNIRNLFVLNVTEESYGHLLNPLLLKVFHKIWFWNEAREICEIVMNSSKGKENKRNSFQNYHSDQTYPKNYFKNKNISTSATLLTQVKKHAYFVT